MDLNFTFQSQKCLLFMEGKRSWKYSSKSNIKIEVQENEFLRNSYQVTIDLDSDSSKRENIFSFNQFRISENSYNRIVLQNWTINDCSEPEIHYEFVINLVENKLFNCTLVLFEKREEYIFLNESECRDDIYIWSFNSYNHNKNGVFTEWLMNGFYNEWTFVNNKKQGEWKSYHKRGHLEEKGYYDHGCLEGEYVTYYSNGEVNDIFYYKKGRRNGSTKSYNKEGFLAIEGNYLNDKRVGKWFYYDKKGEFERFEDYGEKGKPLYFKELDGAGNLICLVCGYTQKIKVFLHNLSDKQGRTVAISGYQCQDCGKFYTRTQNHDPKSEESMMCSCGGDLRNDLPLFCPQCKSKDVEYQSKLLT